MAHVEAKVAKRDTFRLTMLPASDGDALILSWGKAGQSIHNALIDLGRAAAYRGLAEHLRDLAPLDLLVVSHIDADHVEGVLEMVSAAPPPCRPAEVWFNSYRQLVRAVQRSGGQPSRATRSVGQGENLFHRISDLGWTLNRPFSDGVVSTTDLRGPLRLEGGLRVVLLSPSDATLAKLEPTWSEVVTDDQGLDRGETPSNLDPNQIRALAGLRYTADTGIPNGTSIAFFADFGGKRIMLAADAHSEVLEARLTDLGYTPAKPIAVGLLKLSHHGSKANTSPGLLNLIRCSKYAISTDGSRHGHPHAETLARIVTAVREPKSLYFNFADRATLWDVEALRREFGYECRFPGAGEPMIIDLFDDPVPAAV